MKKLFLSILALGLALSVAAQEKLILGVRAGLNVASLSASEGGGSTSSKLSFQVGGSVQYNVAESLPLYLESGLYFTGKGGKAGDAKINLVYLQIPVLVNYHIGLRGSGVDIVPYAGLYYGLGIHGKGKVGDEKADLFGDEGGVKRSDLGIRIGAGVEFLKSYYAGLGYDFGLTNTLKDSDDAKLRTGCFFFQVGYRF